MRGYSSASDEARWQRKNESTFACDALSKRAGGVDLLISHVVREVIERGLDSLERELGRK